MTLRTKLECGAALLFALVVGALLLVVHHYHTQAIDNGFRADSTAAVTDSVRHIADTWQRRAVQTQLEADSLDKALQQKPKVVTSIVLYHDTIRVAATGTVVADSDDSVRSAHFDQYHAPVHTVADVSLPKAPGQGALSLLTIVDPITFSVRFTCGEPVGGIRPGTVSVVQGTPGIKFGLPSVMVAREVCNPAPTLVIGGLKLPWWTTVASGGVGLIAGLLIHH